jgi:hypothetical protein
MSEPSSEKPGNHSGPPESHPNDSQKPIRQNLNSFLNPAFPVGKPAPPPDPNGALQLRMAQMELANKMRLQQSPDQAAPKAVPMRPCPPPGGFGSAQGVFHMTRGNFGQKPTASKRSPYQQVLANASQPKEEPTDSSQEAGDAVIEVPSDAEVKQNEKPKRLKGKRFRNPSL